MIAPVVLATMTVAIPQAALGQESEWPFKQAEYVEVTGISIDDGHYLDYANFLAGVWRKSSDFAKAQGWIKSYEIYFNEHRRKGEPDMYLLTRFEKFASPEEQEARDKAYRAHMAMTDAEMEKASEGRADFRHVDGSMLLRRVIWK